MATFYAPRIPVLPQHLDALPPTLTCLAFESSGWSDLQVVQLTQQCPKLAPGQSEITGHVTLTGCVLESVRGPQNDSVLALDLAQIQILTRERMAPIRVVAFAMPQSPLRFPSQMTSLSLEPTITPKATLHNPIPRTSSTGPTPKHEREKPSKDDMDSFLGQYLTKRAYRGDYTYGDDDDDGNDEDGLDMKVLDGDDDWGSDHTMDFDRYGGWNDIDIDDDSISELDDEDDDDSSDAPDIYELLSRPEILDISSGPGVGKKDAFVQLQPNLLHLPPSWPQGLTSLSLNLAAPISLGSTLSLPETLTSLKLQPCKVDPELMEPPFHCLPRNLLELQLELKDRQIYYWEELGLAQLPRTLRSIKTATISFYPHAMHLLPPNLETLHFAGGNVYWTDRDVMNLKAILETNASRRHSESESAAASLTIQTAALTGALVKEGVHHLDHKILVSHAKELLGGQKTRWVCSAQLALPDSVTSLDLSAVISPLPRQFPASLTVLKLKGNRSAGCWTYMPPLPPSITELVLTGEFASQQPPWGTFPRSVTTLQIGEVNRSKLPIGYDKSYNLSGLPPKLVHFICPITLTTANLPHLPSTLKTLHVTALHPKAQERLITHHPQLDFKATQLKKYSDMREEKKKVPRKY
jgi:hypothetical protein